MINVILVTVGVLLSTAVILSRVIDGAEMNRFANGAVSAATPKDKGSVTIMLLLFPLTLLIGILIAAGACIVFFILNGLPIMAVHAVCAFFFFAQWRTTMIYTAYLAPLFVPLVCTMLR